MILFVSIAPVVVLLVYFYYRDKYEKEPISHLLLALVGGVLSALATLLFFNIVPITFGNDSSIASALYHAFMGAAIPEEVFKFLFLYWFIWNKKAFNEYYDGIIYAVFVSLGFAGFENFLYVSKGGLEVGVTRAFLSVPAHALFAIPMGYYFSLARFAPKHKKRRLLLRGVLLAILAHGLFDFILMHLSADTVSDTISVIAVILFFVFNIMMYRFAFKMIQRHLNASVFKD